MKDCRRIEALFASEGERAGAEFRQEAGARRLANLVDKGDAFVECILEPGVLAHVGYVLGPRFKLSSLNARSANPRSDLVVMNSHLWHGVSRRLPAPPSTSPGCRPSVSR